jgi:hypothetical protein
MEKGKRDREIRPAARGADGRTIRATHRDGLGRSGERRGLAESYGLGRVSGRWLHCGGNPNAWGGFMRGMRLHGLLNVSSAIGGEKRPPASLRGSHLVTFKRVLKWVVGLSFLGCAACSIAYVSIGSSLDEQGILHEPFALIPLGWLFLLAGLAAGMALAVTALVARK